MTSLASISILLINCRGGVLRYPCMGKFKASIARRLASCFPLKHTTGQRTRLALSFRCGLPRLILPLRVTLACPPYKRERDPHFRSLSWSAPTTLISVGSHACA